MLVFLTLITAAAQQPAASPKEDTAIKIGEKHKLHSKILNEDRPYWVYLPESYGNTTFAPKKYPVMYLLDGDAHFQSATGVVQFMSSATNGNIQIPEMIVIAIPNTDRTRDLTPTHSVRGLDGKDSEFFASSGGGESFFKFLRDELIPRVEADYRTVPYRLLVGHSFGGLFAVDALLREPQTFQSYIAIDPSVWWDNHAVLRKERQVLPGLKGRNTSIYISIANNPRFRDYDTPTAENDIRDFGDFLKANTSSGIRSKTQYYGSEDHGSVPLISLYDGLLFVFDGYKPPVNAFLEQPSLITEHFKKLTARYGFEILPPEDFVGLIGYVLLNQLKDPKKAIECLTINVSLYPRSFNAYQSLGEAYAANGDKALAIRNYERSLELNPGNQNAVDALKKLKQP